MIFAGCLAGKCQRLLRIGIGQIRQPAGAPVLLLRDIRSSLEPGFQIHSGVHVRKNGGAHGIKIMEG